MPPSIDRRDDILEIKMPPHNRLCLSTLGSRDTWIDPAETVSEIAPMTVGESPGYVAESNPEEDPKEYEDDETEDGPVNYSIDEGDDGDDNDGDSSRDNIDDEDEDEEE
nr:hypothetical protein [Tanacetum cinerariifolium]